MSGLLSLFGMEISPINLTDLLNLGGVFVFALLILYSHIKLLSAVDKKLVKVLTLLAVLTKTQTNFNGVDSVLGVDSDKVLEHLQIAEDSHSDTV